MKSRIVSFLVCTFVLCISIIANSCNRKDQNVLSELPENSFRNPLLQSGADPWTIYQDGYYYFTATRGSKLVLWKTKDLTDLKNAETKDIWIPPQGEIYSHALWAPEIHFLDRKWYFYFAADDGDHMNHRMHVLENESPDPMEGEFVYKGKIVTDEADNWAIDGSVFEHKGELYFIWSGWREPLVDVETQRIYIAKMENPWSLASERVQLSEPEYDWERLYHGHDGKPSNHIVYVNEGPQMLKHGNRLNIIYSASGCWTADYCLGMISTDTDSDLLDPSSWTKHPEPLFRKSEKDSVYGPGHNSFFKSPDGTEDWILYHAVDDPNYGCSGRRNPRAQKISWTNEDFPILGTPLHTDSILIKPSGTQ